ncbi:MAG: hypothetical protein RI947_578 [Candidatus Parcubacteria bacterium]
MNQYINNEVIKKVLQIVLSSTRTMPAHYSSNGDHTQSFFVDFEIEKDDEYNMASFAFYKGAEAIANCKVDIKPTDLETSAIIKRGEDIVVGSYILKKLGDSSHLVALMDGLAKANAELAVVSHVILEDKEIQDYFVACQRYGWSKDVPSEGLEPPTDRM